MFARNVRKECSQGKKKERDSNENSFDSSFESPVFFQEKGFDGL